jgi:predicted Zn-dependent peptidase
MRKFKKTVLENGITVVTESHPTSHAASIGIWVQVGTRHESSRDHGVTHFLEHLVFKGTKKRSAFQISKSLEALGGELNAFTTREYTCYHAYVLKDHSMIAMDVLSDLVQNMDLKKADFDLEKSVVLQEIAMGEDQLEELIYDIYLENCFKGHELGRAILGSEKSIRGMTMSQVKDYYKTKYCGANLIVSASGNIDHQEIVEYARKFLKTKGPKRLRKQPILMPNHKPFRKVVDRPTEQLHFLLGMPCSSFRDRDRFEAYIVNALLGGGMTSKLYQSVREKKGLVYTVYSTLNTFKDIGLINVYAASEPGNMKNVIKTVFSELKKVRKLGISASDLELFKTQVKGSILLGSDDIENRMQSIAVNEMVFSKYKSVDAIIAEIDQVSVASINHFIKDKFDFERLGGLLMGGGAGELEDWFLETKV